MKPVNKSAEELNLIFMCNHCDYMHTTETGVRMHMRMRQRIYQVDGINDSNEDTSEETDIVTFQLVDLDCNKDESTEKFKAEEKFSFKIKKMLLYIDGDVTQQQSEISPF